MKRCFLQIVERLCDRVAGRFALRLSHMPAYRSGGGGDREREHKQKWRFNIVHRRVVDYDVCLGKTFCLLKRAPAFLGRKHEKKK